METLGLLDKSLEMCYTLGHPITTHKECPFGKIRSFI